MLNISNIKVYDLKESVIASRNAMRTKCLNTPTKSLITHCQGLYRLPNVVA
jgi:hypothetical protein